MLFDRGYIPWHLPVVYDNFAVFCSHQLFVFYKYYPILVSELFLQDSIVSVLPFSVKQLSNSAMGLKCQL